MNPNICPHCQQALPESYSASYCPHCGKALKPAESTYVEKRLEPIRINWWIVFGVLLAPPLITLLAAFLGRGHSDGVSPAIGFLGGGAGGMGFGIMLALRLGKTTLARVVMGILFSVVFVVVCISLSCFGCMVGGYQLKLE